MKTYLLIAGYNYYPARDTGDWIACYNTEEEANKRIDELKQSYDYDWFDIVDLKDWMYDND